MGFRALLPLLFLASALPARGACTDSASFSADSSRIVDAVRNTEAWLGEQVKTLEVADGPAVKTIAASIAQRTDSVATRFRQVFPDDDDGLMMYNVYATLATASTACDPGLAAVYRGAASMALYSGDDPYRPAYYHALNDIADHASALAHAKRPERVQRLVDKLRSAYIDLVVAVQPQ